MSAEARPGKVALPYGNWPSTITATAVSAALPQLSSLQWDGGEIHWLEGRPDSGRTVAVRHTLDGGTVDLTADSTDVRSRVHEYGGGAMLVRERVLSYVEASDQRIYRQDISGGVMGTAVPVTPRTRPGTDHRYADMRVLPASGGRLVGVRARHRRDGVVHDIVRIGRTPAEPPAVLVSGHHFYASPRPSPDGTMLAWLAWRRPEMPWTGTELWLGRLTETGVTRPRRVTGGNGESVFQPEWSPDGLLHFVTDRSGWWNLHRLVESGVEPVVRVNAEFGWPQWTLDPAAYCFLSEGRLACIYNSGGSQRVGVIDLGTASRRRGEREAGEVREVQELRLPYKTYLAVAGEKDQLYALAAAPDRPLAVIRTDLRSGHHEVVHSPSVPVDERMMSQPENIALTAQDGRTVHGLFYPPAHPRYCGPTGTRPPLILVCHGGPTTQFLPEYRPGTHFWTSRGFAVLELNYSGSSGWGRDYRMALDGHWGLRDVDDCVQAARRLAALGKVDPARMVIRGGSAGGFTALATLAASDDFAAGISYFGISDLRLLRHTTHHFEAHLLDRLVGPWPGAEEEYRRRSPVESCESISVPVLFLHGHRDKVVPVEQSIWMAERLVARGIECRTVLFDDEGHGFARQENIIAGLEAELAFLSQVLKL
ncbi:S9 family peptidase [Streptomyces sp. NRRL F-5123]|uniref:S9 family peptidase n=1 Tax=Streptomyces sp. NRRL F-5123 TaxID=1463856 RepID=UPI00069337CC|nr:prolyl oligopeptidase family serine peptidase [Streptomyces sp. NRRL F-5123]